MCIYLSSITDRQMLAQLHQVTWRFALVSQEKLRLDFDDGQAVEWMQVLINESATAMMPQIMETTHRWAQYWR